MIFCSSQDFLVMNNFHWLGYAWVFKTWTKCHHKEHGGMYEMGIFCAYGSAIVSASCTLKGFGIARKYWAIHSCKRIQAEECAFLQIFCNASDSTIYFSVSCSKNEKYSFCVVEFIKHSTVILNIWVESVKNVVFLCWINLILVD